MQWQQAAQTVRDGGLGILSAVMLAPSAFCGISLLELQAQILPPSITIILDKSLPSTLLLIGKF